jgi:hypothetical protein
VSPLACIDYREAAGNGNREDESTSKKLIGALNKLNPFGKDKKKDSKYSPSIVHTSATGQGAPPQVGVFHHITMAC